MNKYYIIGIFAVILLIGVIFLGYRSGFGNPNRNKSSEASSDKKLPVIIVGAEAPGDVDLASRIILQKGWDREAGFQIELRPITSDAAVPALTYGTVDMITIAPLTAVSLVNQKKPVVFLANGLVVNCPFFVNQDSDAKSWQDLKGKKVGTTTDTGPSFTTFKVIMKAKENIDVNKYFQISHSAAKELIPRLTRGEIDGAIGRCSEIGIAKAYVEAKFKSVGNITDIAFRDSDFKELMLEGLVTTKSWIDLHGDEAQKIQDLYYKAYAYIASHPDVFDDPQIKKAYALEDASPELLSKIKELVPTLYTFVAWKDIVESEYRFLELAQKGGLLDILPPKDEIFFNSD